MDLRQVQLAPDAVRLLPEALARRYRALVLQADEPGPLVAMADPTDLFAYDELAAALKRPIRLALAKEADLLRTMDTVYRRTDEIASIAQEVGEELEADIDIEQLAAEEGSPDAPVIRLIQTMFHDAMQVGASDVHIEPGDSALRVRQRVDGHLQEQVIEGGRRVAGALTTRLKLMSGLDIAEKRLPQDGRFSVKVGGKAIDVRLSTMPTQHGESVVMRLLDQSSSLMNLDALGMAPPLLARFRLLIERSAGMVLVTGPTGSGKTTTLYSALHHLNQPDTKIITVEDPVEYRPRPHQSGAGQRENRLGFRARAAHDAEAGSRHHPGRRDARQRDGGDRLRAAITGHLVFSTLHTMSALATVHRLLDMGAPGYMIAAAVHGIVAQRLLRRVCENCARPAQAGPHEAALLKAQFGAEAAAASFRAGSGCTYCNLTGYRGRIAVYELLEIDRTLTDAILRGDLGQAGTRPRARAPILCRSREAPSTWRSVVSRASPRRWA